MPPVYTPPNYNRTAAFFTSPVTLPLSTPAVEDVPAAVYEKSRVEDTVGYEPGLGDMIQIRLPIAMAEDAFSLGIEYIRIDGITGPDIYVKVRRVAIAHEGWPNAYVVIWGWQAGFNGMIMPNAVGVPGSSYAPFSVEFFTVTDGDIGSFLCGAAVLSATGNNVGTGFDIADGGVLANYYYLNNFFIEPNETTSELAHGKYGPAEANGDIAFRLNNQSHVWQRLLWVLPKCQFSYRDHLLIIGENNADWDEYGA